MLASARTNDTDLVTLSHIYNLYKQVLILLVLILLVQPLALSRGIWVLRPYRAVLIFRNNA